MQMIEGQYTEADGRYAIVVGRFNQFVVDSLVEGAVDALVRHGVDEDNITVIRVPGAYEIPLAAQAVAEKGDVDAIIALGAVIRGSTPHFDYVAGESASGLNKVQMDTGVPCAFGVLTVDTIEQAIERAGTKAGNKGADAALVAIEMVSVLRQISERDTVGSADGFTAPPSARSDHSGALSMGALRLSADSGGRHVSGRS